MKQLLLGCAVAAVCSGSVWAHHTTPGRTHPTVTIPDGVMADGKPLPAGKYEIYITDQRPEVGTGVPSDAQRIVEFAQNNTVVAREIAEVFPRGTRETVGTSGSTGGAPARVERLREGDFVRISINEADGRYLIHLPTGRMPAPAPAASTNPTSSPDRPAAQAPAPAEAPATPANPQ